VLDTEAGITDKRGMNDTSNTTTKRLGKTASAVLAQLASQGGTVRHEAGRARRNLGRYTKATTFGLRVENAILKLEKLGLVELARDFTQSQGESSRIYTITAAN
jgi:hypothetical protein